MDWGTRRKPLGAIVAWGSLAVFAIVAILGIAGVVMGLQPRPAPTTQAQTAQVDAAPVAPVEERLPEDVAFTDAQPVEAPKPAVAAVDKGSDMIASTFDQLVEPITVPASQVPEGAIVTGTQPAAGQTAVADAGAQLPMAKGKPVLTGRPKVEVGRNAAAWAIEAEVPDSGRNVAALGYAAQPGDSVRVGDSSINVRSAPSPSSKRLFALASGAEVDVTGKVTGKSGDWVAITDSKDREGWVDASLLENLDLKSLPVVKNPPAAETEAPASATSLKKVASSGVTVRSGPGKGNKSLFNLSGGAQVSVLDESKGWLKIRDAQGRTGWAYKSYIKG